VTTQTTAIPNASSGAQQISKQPGSAESLTPHPERLLVKKARPATPAWILLLLYAYMAMCLQRIAKKTATSKGWLAWVPFVNLYLSCKIARKPGWTTLFFFIPVMNIVMAIIVSIGIAKARGKPGWLGLFSFIPVANLILPAYLALSR
jgi:hypothetical protein